MSIAKGYEAAGKDALSIGANTFQFFTRNPRGGKAKELSEKDIDGLRKIMEENKGYISGGFIFNCLSSRRIIYYE